MSRAFLRPLRWRRAAARRSAPATVGRAAGNFLPDTFPAAVQLVEMAFGADPTTDPATWQWVDVTRYFLWSAGVTCTIGYQNESPSLTPAIFAGTIRNDQPNGGDFTVGNALSPRWPYIVDNVPTRARLDVGNGPSLRLQGYSTSWKPTRDVDGRLNLVSFQAHGATRYLRQRQRVPESPMARYHMLAYRFPTNTNSSWPFGDQGYHGLPTHLWKLEEGSGAILGANAIDPTRPLVADGSSRVPQFGADSYLPGVASMTRFNDGSSLSVNLPVVAPGGTIEPSDTTQRGIRTQILLRVDESTRDSLITKLQPLGDATTARVLTIKTSVTGADVQQIVVYLDADATDGLLLYCDALTAAGASVTGSAMGGEVGIQWERGVYITVDIVAVLGGSTQVRFSALPLTTSPTSALPDDAAVSTYDLQNLASATLRGVTGYALAEFANLGGAALGMLSTYTGPDDTYPDRYPNALQGRTGDTVATRLYRLGVEEGVPIEIIGDASDIPMGPQRVGAFLDLVQEAAAVDQGLYLDGLGPGLTYIARSEMYSRAADLTLDAGAGDELGPDDPQHDDAGRVDAYTATSGAGSSQTFARTDASVVYRTGGEHRAAFDTDLYQIAAWRVGLGSSRGLRWPRFRFNLAKPFTSTKAQRWIEMLPGRRLDVLDVQPDTADTDRSQLLLGWTERWNSKSWEVSTNAVDYAPYAVTVLAEDSGTDSDFIGWLESDGATTLGTVLPAETLFDGFESGVAAWVAQNSWAFAQDATNVHTGSWAVKLTPPGATASGGVATAAGTPCAAGQQYLVAAWFYSVAGWTDCRAAVDWYDVSNAFISSSLGSATSVPAATWTPSIQTVTAPAGAATARPRARQGGTPAASDVLWVDDIVFHPLLQLVIPSGPVATNDTLSTYADDLDGLLFDVAGVAVRVLAITGTTSPQTLVIDPTGLPKALPSGSAVAAENPVRLGL